MPITLICAVVRGKAARIGVTPTMAAAETGNDNRVLLTVRRGSRAVILTAVEECIAGHHARRHPAAEALAALARPPGRQAAGP